MDLPGHLQHVALNASLVPCALREAGIPAPSGLLFQMHWGTTQQAGEVEAMTGLSTLSEVKGLIVASLIVPMSATTGDTTNPT